MAKVLVEEGTGNVNAKEEIENETALHEAAANGHDSVAQVLIQNDADVNAKQSVRSENAPNLAAHVVPSKPGLWCP